MEKTVAADAAENMPEEYPPDVVAAAEEAAALIWNLLYGQTEALPVAIPPVAMTPGQTDDMPIDMPIDLPIEMMPAAIWFSRIRRRRMWRLWKWRTPKVGAATR